MGQNALENNNSNKKNMFDKMYVKFIGEILTLIHSLFINEYYSSSV